MENIIKKIDFFRDATRKEKVWMGEEEVLSFSNFLIFFGLKKLDGGLRVNDRVWI